MQAPVALIPDIKPEERELIRSLVRAGLTQPQVAELTGWSQQAVSKWAKGVVIDGSLPPVVEMLYQRRQCIAGCTLVAVRDIARLVPCGLLGNSARSLNADTLNDGGQYLWCS